MVRRNIDHEAHKLTYLVYVLGGVLLLLVIQWYLCLFGQVLLN